MSDQLIFIKNVPFTTKNTGDGLFCIIHNNSECHYINQVRSEIQTFVELVEQQKPAPLLFCLTPGYFNGILKFFFKLKKTGVELH